MMNGDVYLDTNAAAHYFRKKYSMIDGILLSRGYNKLATKDDQPSDVSHLVFIAHGIGQTLGSITWDCIRLRETCSRLKKKYFTKYKGRLEFLPIEWRTNLPLNEGIIRSVTITDCQPLRAYLNSTALDIMYYTSSIQRMEIMRAFHHEVVRLYSLFCARNPHFTERGGKVSIMAHSLGAVVAFDVLTTSTPMYSDMAYICMLQKMNNEFNENCDLISHHTRLTEIERKLLNRTESQKDVPELPSTASFPEIKNLFCLGSPLGVFLALRGVKPTDEEVSLDKSQAQNEVEAPDSDIDEDSDAKNTECLKSCLKFRDESHLQSSRTNFRLFNIFHPRDPVAYRLEPLILRHYTNIQPAVIGNPKLLKVPDLPKSPPVRPMEDSFGFIEKQPNNKQKAKFSKLQARTNSSSSVPKSLGLALNALANYLKKSHPPGIASLFDTWEEPADGMKMMPSPSERHLRARIDFQLEAEELTVQNLLMHVFTSHGGYWTNEALCLFLLSQIFGEAPKFTSP
uniref:Phospholipase DDHD1 n=1 Tax=Echinococcus granulosus TaxID=6210 RepID=A0A068W821_ECHGR|nr:phospholipase DDHD1 [Echinococcus granulosus]